MSRLISVLLASLAGSVLYAQTPGPPGATAASLDEFRGVKAKIQSTALTIAPGQPLILEFTLRNTNDYPVLLTPPGSEADRVEALAGLPLSHIFSGAGFTGLTIRGDFDRTWTDVYGYVPPAVTSQLAIAPHGVVGSRIDLTAYYPALQRPGMYRIVWQPYGGMLASNQLTLQIAARKQALILMDEGTMTVSLAYEKAPEHVANFIELARSGFYNNRTFHRLEPGFFLQGGCPRGDGSGIRLDGKKLDPEFNDIPFEKGTVAMARLEHDVSSASCQFFICNTRIPDWTGRYTAFGHLVGDESIATLEKVMSTPADPRTGTPQRPLIIRAIRVVDEPPDTDLISGSGFTSEFEE